MADYLDNYEDIVFLDSEIEDDDDSAPVGELISVVDGKVYKAADLQGEKQDGAAEAGTPARTPSAQADDTTEESGETFEEISAPAPENAPEKEDELPPADPIYLYAAGITPAAEEEEASDQPADETVPEAVSEEPAAPSETVEEDSVPAANDTISAPEAQKEAAIPAASDEDAQQTPLADTAAEEAAYPGETASDAAPAEPETAAAEPVAEEAAEAHADAVEPERTAKKKAAKPASHVIYQSGADDGNVWGNAVIKPAKKKAEPKAKEEPAPEKGADSSPADREKPEKKPAAKQTANKQTAKTAKAASNKEETKVAKEKAASEDVKKSAAKAADKKTAAKAETKAAPKKSAEKAAPAAAKATAKPAAAKAKEDTKPAEQVIEAGDESAPHGKFVIKKTDKGNFVYKLYSSNYRVVAIGAGLYTSISNCKTGINSVRNNAATAPIEDQTLQKWEELKFPKWQIYTDKQGEIRLRLLASNGNIVATTNDGYLSKEAAKKGIAAIARAAKGASIVRNDDLW